LNLFNDLNRAIYKFLDLDDFYNFSVNFDFDQLDDLNRYLYNLIDLLDFD
jgi:hypothetical protein